MSCRNESTAHGAPWAGAAPVGGAGAVSRLCRGCVIFLAALACTGAPVASETLPASGLEVDFFDMIDEAPTFRARYVAPDLTDPSVEYFALADDMALLCQQEALPRLAAREPERIVVSLMSAPVEFGVMTPEIRQFFESFRVEGGLCIWEAF
jgi:hypothetical protein